MGLLIWRCGQRSRGLYYREVVFCWCGGGVQKGWVKAVSVGAVGGIPTGGSWAYFIGMAGGGVEGGGQSAYVT